MTIKGKILIVDDEPNICRFLETLLTRQGYEAETCFDGHEAKRHLGKKIFDLALLDINLPDTNGHRLMERIRLESPDTLVVMMTGVATVDSAIEALRNGAYHYLRKPFEAEELLKTVENALNFKRIEAQRKRADSLLRIQRDLGVDLSSTSTVQLALVFALEAALKVEQVDCGGVYVVEQETGDLILMLHRGLPKGFVEMVSHYDAKSPQWKLVMAGEPVYAPYSSMIPLEKGDVGKETGLRAAGIVPIKHEGLVIAALNIASRRHDVIADNVQNALETIASQIGGVMARLKSEETVRQSQVNLRTLFEKMEDFVFIFNTEGKVLYHNPAVQRILGYSSEEICNMTIPQFHPPERLEEASKILGELLAGKGSLCKIPVMAKDGALIPVESMVTKGTWNNEIAYFGVSRDVSERERTQKELEKVQHHLEDLVRERTAELAEVNEQLRAEIAERSRAEEALRQSEAKYRSLIEQAIDIIYTIDTEGNFLEVNEAFLREGNYSCEEILGHNFSFMIHPEEVSVAMEAFKRGLRGEIYEFEMRAQKKDKSYVWYSFINRPIFGKEGEVVGIHGIARNIEQRKVAEEALEHAHEGLEIEVANRTAELVALNNRLSEQIEERLQVESELHTSKSRLNHLLTSSPAIIYSFDAARNLGTTFISENVKQILNYEPQRFLEDPNFWRDRIHPEDRPGVFANLSKNGETGVYTNEYRFQRADGTYGWVRDQMRLVRDREGKPVEGIGCWLDITERKCSENALRESEERFRDVVENSPVGISIIQENRLVYQNPEQMRTYRSPSGSSIDANLKSVHRDDVKKVKEAYESLLTGKRKHAELDFRLFVPGDEGAETKMKWVQCTASGFKYQGKDAILLNALDITRARELEQQVIIKNKMISLGRVAAGMAHEIRNPLTGINSYLYTLGDLCELGDPAPEDMEMMRQIISQIQTASNKIEFVIKRVMDFSRPSSPEMVLMDMNQSVENALELSSLAVRKKGIKLEKSLEKGLPKCYADPNLIEQVVLNLVNNAASAMEKTSGPKRIKVSSLSKNNRLFILVSDSGPGVPKKIREKIFDPFFTTKPDGSGIGLNIAQRIIADHNGFIHLKTSQWGGAEFIVELPIERRVSPR